MARFLSLSKLRECAEDAKAFSAYSGDPKIYNYIMAAIVEAEKYEPEDSFKKCLNCGGKHQRERSVYCCYDCAEEDGAVEK